ncbi:uncharacterized protein TRUGW13939_08775 [Talaromyces rugulosus]|uniref:Ubiquitin-like protease family profile domain-containing protein n=1 Tax=Talaromyces rugulosus TaxID=121627 RepID=A0A7H8RAK2_TALRU|nr:uncharacterized protein TRUGW13939_08775 [Talaromyces rugulosus]QKX61623.1 hypothetical protein TRUGW13939_08775 [Talaromyces rugulosus]
MDSNSFVLQQTPETACSTDKAMKLLREAFQLIISDGVDLRREPEFCMIVDQLCEKAPEAAEAIVGTIQKSPKIDCLNFYGETLAIRKRKSTEDPIYRSPKYARRISNSSDANLVLGQDSTENGVKEENQGTEKDLANDGTPRTKSRSQVVEGQELAIADMNLGVSTDKIPLAEETTESTILDMTLQAVHVIHQLCTYTKDVPRAIHAQILQTIQKSHSGRVTAPIDTQWSDGSRWLQILDMGSSTGIRTTVLNMVEYMGAWEWFDEQCKHAEATVCTKKGKLVERKWISGVGPVTVKEVGDTANFEGKRKELRKRIINQLHRGEKLSKLVKVIGLGILLSPKIWDYTKMGWKHLDTLIKNTQSDHREMELYRILSGQVERLVHEGSPDLHAFYNDLESEELISSCQVDQWRKEYILGSDPLPDAELNAAVDQLVHLISNKVLHKNTPDKEDTISVNGSTELFCNIFEQLRPGRWMSDEIIMAVMQIVDKPTFVRHGLRIPLDEIVHGQLQAIKRPFANWARQMGNYRRVTKEADSLVYFCPINHQNSHYSLLEINEPERKIHHFDSLAERARQDRVSSLIKKEFAGLKYLYEEAATPQQIDGWSCGARVIWNFKRLANGLPIGPRDTVHDSNRMTLEIVDGLMACVEDGRIIKYRD